MGMERGSNGWKKNAVRIKFAVLAKMFAISRGGPSNNL
jgi:hypothetical protein